MQNTQLFLIRGKLGDSLIFLSALQAYLRRHPEVTSYLAMRRNYARLFAQDCSAKLIPFDSRIELIARLLWLRLRGLRFDICAVLWGFGTIVTRFARLSGAKRRIYLDDRYPEAFSEWPSAQHHQQCVDVAWNVLKLIDPSLPRPDQLALMGLRAKADVNTENVVVVPVADEPRRCLGPEACHELLTYVRKRHPKALIKIVINPADTAAAPIQSMALPENTILSPFETLEQLVDIFSSAGAWYGVDTGLYHIAAAMDLPTQALFGPTQPQKMVLSGQRNVKWVRLEALGASHCEVKSCEQPECLNFLIRNLNGAALPEILRSPDACPMRGTSPNKLSENHLEDMSQ